jgi:hypothetical protein
LVSESYIKESISRGVLLDKNDYYLNREKPANQSDDFEQVKLQRHSKIDQNPVKNNDKLESKPPTLNELFELDVLAENILDLLIVNHEMNQCISTSQLDISLHIAKLDDSLSELTGNHIFWAVLDNKVINN